MFNLVLLLKLYKNGCCGFTTSITFKIFNFFRINHFRIKSIKIQKYSFYHTVDFIRCCILDLQYKLSSSKL